jgi:Tol biopolymer transport system component
MALAAGMRLGPYEIQELVGAGGMGEVYRARDTRLERTVAVKVLPTHLTASPEVRERFDREAKTISQLSHPNICALYDVGHQDGTDYLVMEYLEGETLDRRLLKGPLPIEQVIRHGVEIAAALDRAHRQGIVHRDLKPGNVMLTRSGVKLLDFGLAKTFQAQGPSGLTAMPTAAHLTQEGTILGTFQYMAPEQLEGKEADARTDIFALGAVLYEMTTGTKAFAGHTQASLITSIMSANPAPITVAQPLSPAALDRVIRKCLAKDPEDRWQSARDVASELKWAGESGSQAGIPAPFVARRRGRERLAWVVAAVATAAALLFGALYLRRTPAPGERRAFVLMPESRSELQALAISPDDRNLVLGFENLSGGTALFLRRIGSIETKELPGTEDAADPFWSPDGRQIGFFSRGKLKRISLEGGAVQTLADADRHGASWSRSGTIVYCQAFGSALLKVPAAGGSAEPATVLDESRQEVMHAWPKFLPDGKRFVFYARSADPAKSAIFLASLDSKERTLLTPAEAGPLYADPGYLLYAREGALLAQRFDPSSRALSGEPIPLARNVAVGSSNSELGAAVGSNLLVYQVAGPRNRQLTWLDASGRSLSKIGQPVEYWSAALSPDEKLAAVAIADPELKSADLWLLDPVRATRTRLTSHRTDEFNPRWSPDGHVYYTSDHEGFYNLYRKPANGAGAEETVLKSDVDKWLDDVSRDGREILFSAYELKTGYDVWIYPLNTGKPTPLIQTLFLEGSARFSPDGRWITYVTRESGREEIFLCPRAAPAKRIQVSVNGGTEPRWSKDGREIYYISPERTLMAASIVLGGETPKVSDPRPLFGNEALRWNWGNRNQASYEVASDGRFLVAVSAEDPGARPVVAVLDWTAGLPK